MLIGSRPLDDAEAVIEHGVVEGLVRGAERIWLLFREVLRERAILAPVPTDDIGAPSLDEVPGQSNPARLVIEGSPREAEVEEIQKPVERFLVAAMRRRGQKNEVPLVIFGNPPSVT